MSRVIRTYSHKTTKATERSTKDLPSAWLSRSKVNFLHKMAEIELLSVRRNSHLSNFMYKHKESPQYINNAKQDKPGKAYLLYLYLLYLEPFDAILFHH